MTEDNKQKRQYTSLIAAVMFGITVLLVCFFSYFKEFPLTDIIRNTVITGMGAFILLLMMARSREECNLDYNNYYHPLRFFVIYMICLVVSVACGFLPGSGWPYLVVFVSLCLFSNTLVGFTAGTVLLTVSLLLSGYGIEIFIMYFVCGLASCILFKGLSDSYKIGIPLAVSLLFLLTAQTATVVLYANETLKPELFMIPFMNLIVSLIMLLIILKVFYSTVIYLYRDKYMEINDPECPLFIELKENSKEEYYLAMHTAYFCERIAKKLNLDEEASKTVGYYHRIGILLEENEWEKVLEKITPYEFPPNALAILKEYIDKNTPMKKKETAVLLLSNAVISSILYLLAHNKGELDYDQIIDTVFKKKLENSVLHNSDITLSEIVTMRDLFKEEKLYYDFLRRD